MSEEEHYYEEEAHEYADAARIKEAPLLQTKLVGKRGGGFDKMMAVSWGISLAMGGLLLALATVIVLFVTEDEEEQVTLSFAPPMPDQQEEMEQKMKQKQLERSSSSATSTAPIVVEMNIADISVESVNIEVGADVGDVGNISGAGNIGNLSGLGMGAGMGMKMTFMGAQAQGNKFAFIIDYSASMGPEQLRVMKSELSKVLRAMSRDVQVALIFFSGPAFLAGTDPKAEAERWTNTGPHDFALKQGEKLARPAWIPCSPSNVNTMEEQVWNTKTSFGTDWRHPFDMAYSMNPKPDVIYFMTDGSTRNPEETVNKVLKNKRIQVNAIAFGIPNEDAKVPMQTMTESTRGTFKSYDKAEIVRLAAGIAPPGAGN